MHSDKEPRRFTGDTTTEDPTRSVPGRPARAVGGPETGSAVPAETAGAADVADAAERVDTARPWKDEKNPATKDGAGTVPEGTTAPGASTGAGTAGAPTGPAGTTGTGPAGITGAATATGLAGTADPAGAKPVEGGDDEIPRLLDALDEQGFRDRWRETQSKFVDDPREAVHSADALVADVIRTLTTTFAQQKQELEGQWSQGERTDTEELRRALRRYRSFFNRLLGD
ncbi:hypothetical protein AB0P32_18000 [Streptomyces sp. NPDC085995]|uniref:hypothetical protein n=1 Tax=Streptomyces sp. NPDC085995 TaxID=3154861 RepID=UPI00342CC9CA